MAKDKLTHDFPKVGKSNANAVVRKPTTKSVPKTGNSKGGMAEGATAEHRAGIHEKGGATLHPQVAMYKANAPEASANKRNVRILGTSDEGIKDVWRKGMGSGN